jgi:malonyl-CoA O-methyltransferase
MHPFYRINPCSCIIYSGSCMTEQVRIDKRLARRAFERAASGYDRAAVLQREVNNHLLERFDYIRFTPTTILDVGCGTGYASFALHKRFKQARIYALDMAMPMLRVMRSQTGFLTRLKNRLHLLGGDAERLPLPDQSVDLVYSSLTIQWVNDIDTVLSEFRRVLKPGGMLLFSTFGPDTLKELRLSWQAVDAYSHVSPFLDMHDIGDAMMRARLAEPVMDVENFTMTYADVFKLMRDLKAIGAHNVTSARSRGLTGKRRMQQLEEQYEQFRSDSVLPASYEVVYGHAWAPVRAEQNSNEVTIPIDTLRTK